VSSGAGDAGAVRTEARPSARDVAIRAESVDLAYGREVVMRDASFECRAGEVTALVGPNGSGKSTLLHALAGLLEPRRGTLEVLGGPPRSAAGRIAYALQSTTADARLPVTVREIVAMARYPRLGLLRRPRPVDRDAVDDALDRVELGDLARRRLDELSGGQRQRVFVAQGLAQEADVLLLDEPVTGLDLVSRTLIIDAIAAERARGVAVLVTTHSLGEAAAADQMLLLAGRVVAAGATADVLTQEHLAEAYGERVLNLDQGVLLLDDPGHGHRH
jgi:ABC-type Mn2+/Zn2+ transport system ATPase subunit